MQNCTSRLIRIFYYLFYNEIPIKNKYQAVNYWVNSGQNLTPASDCVKITKRFKKSCSSCYKICIFQKIMLTQKISQSWNQKDLWVLTYRDRKPILWPWCFYKIFHFTDISSNVSALFLRGFLQTFEDLLHPWSWN